MAAPRDIPIRVTADVTKVRCLTGGDAAVVIALLLFILAWGAGFCVLWEMAEADGDTADIGAWEAVWLLWLAGGPMLWAAGLVKAIVSDSTKRAWLTRGES